jgi:hypothetical protein
MRREPLIDVPPWALPLIVVALTTPIVVAFLTAGPFLGLMIGGLVAAALAATAIRLSTEPPRRRTRRRHTRASKPGRPER